MTYSEKGEPKEMKTVERVKLTELCELNMGQSPDSKSYNVVGKGLPFYQGNADFGTLHPSPRVWCALPQKTARKDDVLLSVRAPVGAVNIATETCCIGRGLAALKARPERSCPLFLYYAMTAKARELVEKSTGSTFKAVNRKVLEELEIPVYSLVEQEQIVAKLQLTDRLIAAHKQQLLKLDELVKSQFVEMFGEPSQTSRWPSCQIGDIADVCVGVVIKPTQYYANTGVPAFRSLNIGEMHVKDEDWVYFTDEGQEKNQKSIIRENDVLVVRSGAPGTACVASKKYAGFNAVDIIIAHPDETKINSIFLAAFTNMPHGKRQIQVKIGGAAQQHFNVGGYRSLQIILPPIEKQKAFADLFIHTDKSKFAIRQSLEQLNLLKSSLMQKYFAA